MQVVIIAGGLATRLGEVTRTVPKSMVQIAGRPFLAYQLEPLKRQGITEVILCVGHLGEQIESYFGDGRQYGLSISYSYEKGKLFGTGGALKNAESLLHDEFFTIYGDSYLTLDFSAIMSYFKKFDRLALMTIFKNYGRYDKSNIAIEGNLIRQYGSKSANEELIYIDYGASLFKKQALDIIPPGTVHAMGDMFQALIERKQLLAYEVDQRFYQIGSREGLKEFEEFIEGKMKS
jgi:NDP-sugar pyrophosphorylase family protein